jgi:hypothetical protein
VVVAAGAVVLALLGGLLLGGGLARAKLVLFLSGWLLLGLATVRLWPKSPKQVAEGGDSPTRTTASIDESTTRVEAVAETLPPLRWMGPVSRRLSPPTKLFVAALLVLASSLALEVVFGVGG